VVLLSVDTFFALADSTNNEAELFTIGACIDRLLSLVTDGYLPSTANFYIFTDSEYCYNLLMGINTPHTNIHLVHHVIRKLQTLRSLAPNTTLHWLPGHLSIDGNEDADKLAKLGATQAFSANLDSHSVIDRVYHLYDHEDSFFTYFTAHPLGIVIPGN
jgi:ribonuclease HI